METALNKDMIPDGAILYTSPEYRGIGTVAVPVHLLTNLTSAEQKSYQSALVSETELDYVHPLLQPWKEYHEGSPEDLLRVWRVAVADQKQGDFAFFIDREGVADKTLLVAQPDHYTMLFNSEASQWVRESLTSYLQTHKPEAEHQVSSEDGAYERYLETLADDILGKRGLTYGRVPASAFRNIWANLDLANMDLRECVEYQGRDLANGGKVEMVLDEGWNAHVVMGKLWDMVRANEDGGANAEATE